MPAGRPRKQIDKADFESLMALQCTLEEVTAFFDHKLGGCSEDTIERWCKRTYGLKFADVAPIKKQLGKISIRRAQFRLMEKGNATMCIFLGKNYLGQTDAVRVESRSDGMLADLINGLKEPADGIHEETAGVDAEMATEPVETN